MTFYKWSFKVKKRIFLTIFLLIGFNSVNGMKQMTRDETIDKDGGNALFNAVFRNKIGLVRRLLESGAKISDKILKYSRSNMRLHEVAKTYILNAFTFQESEDKLGFVADEIERVDGDKHLCISDRFRYEAYKRVKDTIRLAFCCSLREILCDESKTDEDFCDENLFDGALFSKLNELARNNPKVRDAILRTFHIQDETLLDKRNTIHFIEHAINDIDLSFEKSREVQRKFDIYKKNYINSLEAEEERFKFIFGRDKTGYKSKVTIATNEDDRKLHIPKCFLIDLCQ